MKTSERSIWESISGFSHGNDNSGQVWVPAGRAALPHRRPPGRVGRINYSEGAVSFAPAGDDEFTDADLNRPLSPGDKLWTRDKRLLAAALDVGCAFSDADTH